MTRANTEQIKHIPWFAKAGAACSIVSISLFVGPNIFALKRGGYHDGANFLAGRLRTEGERFVRFAGKVFVRETIPCLSAADGRTILSTVGSSQLNGWTRRSISIRWALPTGRKRRRGCGAHWPLADLSLLILVLGTAKFRGSLRAGSGQL